MCQWANHLGATVIGTVSSDEKADARAPAWLRSSDHLYAGGRGRARARIDRRKGVPVVYDSVGASTFELSLSSLQRRGMVVSFGSASGPVPPLDIFRLNRMGSLYVTSAGLADYIHTRAELLERADDLFAAVKSGAVKVTINQRYPLAEAARAHRDLEARRTTGSSVILP